MAVPTSLPTKELLFSKISAKYWSLFLWKKVRTSSVLQKRTGWQRVPRRASAGCSALRPRNGSALVPGDPAGDAGVGSALLNTQLRPTEVSSPVFCSGSQTL